MQWHSITQADVLMLELCRKKPLTLLPLIALIFFEVSGGPFGTEVRITVCAAALLSEPSADHMVLCCNTV